MHKMGCLGPIDPSVANIFNPAHPSSPGQTAPISVEDVTAFFKLVKDEVGITHEDELVQSLIALTEKIHPLALGNVQRHHNQSRMMARKLLRLHMSESQGHEIEQLIDTLKSNLFFHAHPINRVEAKADLKLKVVDPPPEVEALMWKLYLEYENDLKLNEPFNPVREMRLKLGDPPGQAPLTTARILQQIQELAKQGVGVGAIPEEALVKLAVAMIPFVEGSGGVSAGKKVNLDAIPGVYVESVWRADVFKTDLALERTSVNTPGGPQEAIKQEALWQRWEREE